MESKHLDDHIKKALENFEAQDQDNSWAQMEDLLNDPANSDLAERGEDHIYRAKLKEVTPEMPAEHWDLMAASLNAIDAEPIFDEVDGKAYEHLSNLEVPYEEAHWPLMEEKIVEELGWRNAVIRYKLVEMLMVFLFAFTFIQYWPEAKTLLPKIKNEVKQAFKPDAMPIATIENTEINTQKQSTAEVSEEPEAIPTFENGAEVNLAVDEAASINSISSKDESRVLGDFLNSRSSKVNSSTSIYNEIIERESFSKILALESKEAQLENSDLTINLESKNSSKTLFDQFTLINELSSLPLAFLPAPLQNLPDCKTCSESKERFFRIGMHGIVSYDLIRPGSFAVNQDRQLDLVEDQAGGSKTYLASSLRGGSFQSDQGKELKSIDEVESFGYGWGLSLGLKKDRFEIVSGLNYLIKKHTPEKVFLDVTGGDLRFGFAGYGWAGSQFNILNVPLGLRFDIVNNAKWKVYGQAGLSFSMVLEVIDNYEEVILNRFGNFKSSEYGLENIIENTTLFDGEKSNGDSSGEILADAFEDPEYLNQKSGILHNGDFSSYSFFNIEPAFGVERRFTQRYSGFFKGGYSHRLNGQNIGDTGVNIHSFHAQVGLKVSLKKRNK